MSYKTPSVTPSAPEPYQSQKIANACTAEVCAHIAVFSIAVVPILVSVFPAILCSLAIFVLVQMWADLGGIGVRYSQIVSEHWMTLCALSLGLAVLIAVTAALRSAKLAVTAAASSGTVMKQPRGPKGEGLLAIVEKLWNLFGASNQKIPHVVWFANFNVLAHASDLHGRQEIQVSSGLWERVVREDPAAEAILTHEIAHLVYRDSIVFRILSACVAATRAVLRLTLGVGVFAVILLIGQRLVTDITHSVSMKEVFARSVTIAIVSCFILIVLPLGEIIVRRYAGFIASLMEMRADVSAALWMEGLDHFARLFSSDPTLRRSTLGDLGHSLFSLNLTHISETERLDLLRNTDRLITPKLRYFALSLALPFLFPLNSITPLIAGGAIDHMLITSVVVVLHAAVVSMILLAADAAVLSWHRSFGVAAALCVAAALPRINLYELGYLMTHEALSLSFPQGFGSEPVSFVRIGNDLRVSIGGLVQQFVAATGSGWIILSIVITGVSLRILSVLAGRRAKSTKAVGILLVIATVVVCFVVIMSSYDPWRDGFFRIWPLSMADNWFAWTEPFPWLRLCAPVLSVLTLWLAHGLVALFETRNIS